MAWRRFAVAALALGVAIAVIVSVRVLMRPYPPAEPSTAPGPDPMPVWRPTDRDSGMRVIRGSVVPPVDTSAHRLKRRR